ncbi:hypothetical protein CAPN010_07970 [Capnocytophaga cynodegmi]|uniref:hypothetical protein n=1 Tax=Capnocytophaga cynodegmi TaxID=28189 RepID=UPI001EE27713|nr:hypothetical protein [Capnocytophaga cynodegmi]GJQ06639.1 hypothetical protein CAPN010_07970 [Capnocytophaga cynodegmi]
MKNKFLLGIFFLGTVVLPALGAFATQNSNAFSLFAYYSEDKDAGAAAIVVDTLVAAGAASILCGVQAVVAIVGAG